MRYRKYGDGGTPDFQSTVNSYAQAGTFASDIIQNIDPGSGLADYGGGALKGAASGAAIGTAILPGIGTAVGGAVGLVSGIIGASKKRAAEVSARQQQVKALAQSNIQRQNAMDKSNLSGYNTNGNNTVTGYYAYGGYLKALKPVKVLKSPLPKLPGGGVVGGGIKRVDPNAPINITPSGTINPATGLIDLGYSRVYGSQNNIPNNNIQALRAQYSNDPSVMNILNRNIAPQGQVPMYGADDGDAIRQLLGKYQAPQPIVANGQAHLADGGAIPSAPPTPPTTLTGQGSTTQLASDTHQYNGPSHADGGIPIDTTGNGQPNAEVEGNEVQKGNQIYSDRLTISPMLDLQLKAAKVKVDDKSTYAEVAAKLGKLKGKFESKLGSYSPVALRTGKAMVGRYDNLLQQTFADQEQSKQMMGTPQMAFGGELPKFAGGGTVVDPYKARMDAINTQLAKYNADYQATITNGQKQKLNQEQQQQRTAGLAKMNAYRQHIEERLQDHIGDYQNSANTFTKSVSGYNASTPIHNKWIGVEDPNKAKVNVDKQFNTVNQGLEMLKRLDPSKVDFSKPNWESQIGIDASGFNGPHILRHDYYLGLTNPTNTTNPTTNTAQIAKPTTPIVAPTVSSVAPTTLTPPAHTTSPLTVSGNGRYKALPTRFAPLGSPESTNALQPDALSSNVPASNQVFTPTATAPTTDSPGFMSRVNGAINDYGADAINYASLIGNQGQIAKMQAPTFTYNAAPSYNYTDRSGLAKNENAVATSNMMKSVVNTSAQGQQAQKAGIFAQNLEANNQINNNENQRYDAYNNNYDNRALQVNMGNTDIANKQADVTTQVNNDKIGMGIQAQNAFNQGEIQNQATRSQQDLDFTKTNLILAASQDPTKLAQLLSTTTDPVRRRQLQLMMRGSN